MATRSRRDGCSANGAISMPASCRASELLRHVIEHSLLAAHRHVFGVFFWFVLLSTFGLGPAGAVLYRMAELAGRYWAFKSGDGAIAVNETLMQLSQRLFHLLDYVPARLTASGFAVVGNFEEAVNCWRRDASLWKYDNEGVILAAAAGAVGVSLGGGSAPGLTPDRAKTFTAGASPESADASGSTPGATPQLGAPAQRRRPGLALGRALDAAAGAALARAPDRLSRRDGARRTLGRVRRGTSARARPAVSGSRCGRRRRSLSSAGPAGEEQRVGRLGVDAVAEGDAPQAVDRDRGAVGSVSVPRKAPVAGSKALILPSPKLPTSRALLNGAEVGRRHRHAPGRVQLAARGDQPLHEVARGVEDVDHAEARAGDVVVRAARPASRS